MSSINIDDILGISRPRKRDETRTPAPAPPTSDPWSLAGPALRPAVQMPRVALPGAPGTAGSIAPAGTHDAADMAALAQDLMSAAYTHLSSTQPVMVQGLRPLPEAVATTRITAPAARSASLWAGDEVREMRELDDL